jgi:hypothetical protein
MTAKIRPAEPKDGDALGRMGGALARMHHDMRCASAHSDPR